MSDFHQFGPVTAIPRLVSRDPEEMEHRLEELAQRFPVSLVVPMIPSEMDRPALARILDELCAIKWVDPLVVSLNRATRPSQARTLNWPSTVNSVRTLSGRFSSRTRGASMPGRTTRPVMRRVWTPRRRAAPPRAWR